MDGYLNLINSKSLPVSINKGSEYRDFSRYNTIICKETFKETLFSILGIVAEIISKEMSNTKGGIVFYGWTKIRTHYVGVYVL